MEMLPKPTNTTISNNFLIFLQPTYMKRKILTLVLGLLLLLTGKAFSQNGAWIFGATNVQVQVQYYYEVQWDAPLSQFTSVWFEVQGGYIVNQHTDPTWGTISCTVVWYEQQGPTWLHVTETLGGAYGHLDVSVQQTLDPGTLSTTYPYFNYLNNVPSISQTPATGGNCGTGYSYMWYSSPDGVSNWTFIGYGQSYPVSAPQLTARTFIRRYVECGGNGFTNTLEFNYQSTSWENRNFIRTNEVWYAGKQNFIAADNIAIGQKQQSVVFFDGLGRPEQSVVVGASPETGVPASSKKDLVTPIEYDALGREVKKYLAYQAGTADGKYKLNAGTAQNTFMTAKYPGETRYYAETDLESSPLNRPLKTKAPGQNWGATGVGISTTYDRNTPDDGVRIWKIDAFTPGAIPVSNITTDIYPAYSLSEITTTDERGKKIVEYKDSEDRVILKKQQLLDGANLTAHHDGWLCTYYVYDDFGRMRFTITPKAMQQMLQAGNTTITPQIAAGLCYSYTYDSKGRLIEKKLPDDETMWMVYDNRDRLVFSQDGNQREGKANSLNIPEWTFFLYDAQNRQIATGIMRDDGSDPHTRSTLQSIMDNPAYGNLGERTFSIQTDVAESVTAFNPVPLWSSLGVAIYYYDVKINAVNYYDGWTAGQYISETLGYPSNFENIDAATPVNRNRGLQTGTKVRVLNVTPDKFLSSATIYDDKGRVIQSNTTNYLNHGIRLTNQYDFTGKVRSTLYKEIKTTVVGVVPAQYTTTSIYTILSKYEQDHAGRPKQIKKNVTRSFHTTQAVEGPNPVITTTGERIVVENTYDELGQLASKKLAPGYAGPNGPYLENLIYEYNIRGWMTGINKTYVSNSSGAGSFFGMELGYDKAGNAAFNNTVLNGNVAGMAWKTRGDNIPRKFDYAYDNANRLASATFKQRDDFGTPNNWGSSTFNFSVPLIQYDFNGNISRMEQMGMNFSGIVPMDRMTYGYDNTSNKLKWVAEDVNTDYKLNDFTDKNAGAGNIDYTYDFNGNLKEDKNKGITSIKYNYLNLPEQVDFDNNRGNIKYIYDATGNKLQKIVTDNTPVTGQLITTTTYSGPITYTGNDLYLTFEEGRVRFAKTVTPNMPPAFTFDYFVKDHLGNIRMVLTEDAQTDQYPAATMETAATVQEDKYYKISNRTDKPAALQGNSSYDQRYGQKMSKLTTQEQKIGPSILMKVMAGDIVHSKTDYYFQTTGTQVNSSTLLNDLVNNLIGHLNAGQAGQTAKTQSSTIGTNVTGNNIVGNLIADQNSTYVGTNPKAHLNYIVFDEQFKAVKKGSIQVQNSGPLQPPLTRTDIAIDVNGWIYVFVNNESQQPVYFDNFQVTHVRGNILEETHYYPFGLTMKAISPRALSINPVNRHKYNGKEIQQEEFSDGSGLEGYDFGARIFDPQTGRWQSIDPQAEDFPNVSPYSYAVNNPALYVDKDGKFVNLILQYGINVGINVAVQMLTAYMFDPNVKSWGDAWDKVSMWDAIWDGASDMISSKKLRMAANGVKGIFNYIDDVGFRNITASGLINSGLMGILEPIIGDAIARKGVPYVMKGLQKLGFDGPAIKRALGIPDPPKVKVDLKAGKTFSMARGSTTRYSPSLYRQNLKTLTGMNPASNIEAHHIFPQAPRFQAHFDREGIDIHDPVHLQWWERGAHNAAAADYNRHWDDFFSRYPNASKEKILEFGRILMTDMYHIDVNF
jgi:RHS repeat-associated protein